VIVIVIYLQQLRVNPLFQTNDFIIPRIPTAVQAVVNIVLDTVRSFFCCDFFNIFL